MIESIRLNLGPVMSELIVVAWINQAYMSKIALYVVLQFTELKVKATIETKSNCFALLLVGRWGGGGVQVKNRFFFLLKCCIM